MKANLKAFADELEKISGVGSGLANARGILTRLGAAVKANPKLIKYPAIGGGSIAAWKILETAKRQRDLGAAMEAQMEGQQ